MGTPLIAKGQVKGVLEIFQRSPFVLNPEQRAFLEILAGQAAIAIDSAQLYETLHDSNFELMMAYDETIEGWSRAMDMRDKETEGHTQRVTELTLRLAASIRRWPTTCLSQSFTCIQQLTFPIATTRSGMGRITPVG